MTGKPEFRKRAAAIRGEAHAAVDQHLAVEALDDELKPFSGHPIGFYMPMRTEIDPRPAMVRALLRGPVLLPVVVRGRPLEFRQWHPGLSLLRDDYGVEYPDADQPVVVPDVLVVPLLAFDGHGHRLGYGGGYYDRTLAALRRERRVTAIGFAFAAQEVPVLPHTSDDERLDMIITERRVKRFD